MISVLVAVVVYLVCGLVFAVRWMSKDETITDENRMEAGTVYMLAAFIWPLFTVGWLLGLHAKRISKGGPMK